MFFKSLSINSLQGLFVLNDFVVYVKCKSIQNSKQGFEVIASNLYFSHSCLALSKSECVSLSNTQ